MRYGTLFKVSVLLGALFVSCVSTGSNSARESERAQLLKSENPNIRFAAQLSGLLEKQRWEEALQLFDTFSPEHRAEKRIQYLYLSTLISAGKLTHAQELAEKLGQDGPTASETVQLWYAHAMIAQAKRDVRKKKQYVEKILAQDPHDLWALTERGYDFLSVNDYAQAVQAFSRALRVEPRAQDARVGLGKVYYLQGKMQEAEAQYRQVLQDTPEHEHALAECARVKAETNRVLEAIRDLERVVQLDPHDPAYCTDLGTYLSQAGKKERAAAAFERAVALSADAYFAHIYLGGIYDELGRAEKAIEHYQRAVQLYPKYHFSFESLGVLFWEQQRWEEAREAFATALTYAPTNISYALMTALCLCQMGQAHKAQHFMRTFIRTVDRTRREVEYFLCRLFVDLSGEQDMASRISKIKSVPQRIRYSFYLAFFYELGGLHLLAEKHYGEVESARAPSSFEHRLAVSALGRLRGRSSSLRTNP